MSSHSAINPLTTEFFPPRQHIFMHSAHTTFRRYSSPAAFAPQRPNLVGPAHMERPLWQYRWWYSWPPTSPAIGGQRWMSAGFSPSISLNLDQIWLMAHLIPPICMFSWGPGWGLWISLESKILGPMNLIKIKNTHDRWRGGCCPPFRYPPASTFSGGGASKSDQIFEFVPQSRP